MLKTHPAYLSVGRGMVGKTNCFIQFNYSKKNIIKPRIRNKQKISLIPIKSSNSNDLKKEGSIPLVIPSQNEELSAIQQNAPRKVAILGTRHFSYLHQQIVELLTYANVLIGNHVFTSGGAGSGTNAAVIRGALRAEKPDLLTVVLPQSLEKQPPDVRDLLEKVQNVIEMRENDELPLDVASRLCNSDILSRCEHLISFAFHDSIVVLEAASEAKSLNKLVTLLYLD